MEEPTGDDLPLDLGSIESINNLDTARMTLRWALERLSSVDKLKAEAIQNASLSRRRLLMESACAVQSELHLARMEEWLLVQLARRIEGDSGLRERSEGADSIAALRQRRRTLEKEYQARKGELEREQASLPSPELSSALERLERQDERLRQWEKVICEHETVNKAQGGLLHTLGDLQARLIGPGAPPAEAEQPAREGEPTPPAPPREDVPEHARRELVGKFRRMLESWDEWEAAHQRALELERKEQKEELVRRLSQGQGASVHDVLQAARKRALEAPARARETAVKEFRRMLDAWKQEAAADWKAREESFAARTKALEAREKEISDWERTRDAQLKALRESWEASDQAKANELRERLRGMEEELRRRGAELERDARETRTQSQALLSESQAAAERLKARLQEQLEGFQQALRLKDAEISSIQAESRAREVSLKESITSLERMVQDQTEDRKLIGRLVAEQRAFQKMLQDRDAQIESLKKGIVPAALETEQAAREQMFLRKEQESSEALEKARAELAHALDRAQEIEPLRKQAGEALERITSLEAALRAKEAELESLRQGAPAAPPGFDQAMKDTLAAQQKEREALERRLKEQEESHQKALALQEREFAELAARLASLCASYRRELDG